MLLPLAFDALPTLTCPDPHCHCHSQRRCHHHATLPPTPHRYGHGDIGREKMDKIIASLMGAEAAMVRLQLFSGTHAISSALFGCLRPGERMLCVRCDSYTSVVHTTIPTTPPHTPPYTPTLMPDTDAHMKHSLTTHPSVGRRTTHWRRWWVFAATRGGDWGRGLSKTGGLPTASWTWCQGHRHQHRHRHRHQHRHQHCHQHRHQQRQQGEQQWLRSSIWQA